MRPVRHLVLRAFVALLALLTVAAPAAAAVGEGLLASHAGRSPVVAHVEDGRRAQCPYVHADDCVLCSALGVRALPGPGAAVEAASLVVCRALGVRDAATWPTQGDVTPRHARGPPTG